MKTPTFGKREETLTYQTRYAAYIIVSKPENNTMVLVQAPNGAYFLPGDDYELELTYNYDHEAYDLGNGYGHIAISTDDLEGLHEKHQAAGFTVTDLKGLPGTAPSYYFVVDPDGYKIEVIRER